MKLAYPIRVWPEGGGFSVQGLPPLDNVITCGEDREDALRNGIEALTGVLESMLDHGQPIPDPVQAAPDAGGGEVVLVEPDPSAAVPILLPKAREQAGLTQGELANRLGVTYQAVQKWERAGANPTVATIQRVLRALGRRLEMELLPR